MKNKPLLFATKWRVSDSIRKISEIIDYKVEQPNQLELPE